MTGLNWMHILKKIVFKDQDQWDIQYFKRLHIIHCITSEGLDLQILSKCFMPYAKLCYCNLFNSLHIKMTGNSNVYDQHICHCICYFLHQLWIVFTSTELIFKAVIFNRKNFINTNPPARSNCSAASHLSNSFCKKIFRITFLINISLKLMTTSVRLLLKVMTTLNWFCSSEAAFIYSCNSLGM